MAEIIEVQQKEELLAWTGLIQLAMQLRFWMPHMKKLKLMR